MVWDLGLMILTEAVPMADKTDKWDDSISGKYYVDRSCISCDACITAAPDNFVMNDDDGHALVSRQPANEEEEEQCKEALEGCPVEAIGDDGP